MAVALVQAKSQEVGSASGLTITPGSAMTAGNLVVIGVGVFGETTANISVSDTLGSTWTKVLTSWQADSTSGIFFNFYYAVLASSGSNGVTAQVSPSHSGFWGNCVFEFSGVGTPSAPTVKGGNAATSVNGTFSGAPFTPSAGDLLVAFYGDEGNSETITAANSFSLAAAASAGTLNNAGIYKLSATSTDASSGTHAAWNTQQAGFGAGSIYVALTPAGGGPTDPFPAGYGWQARANSPIFRVPSGLH